MKLDRYGLEKRRALVVGGGGGIGHAISEALLQSGARVVVVDVTDKIYSQVNEFRVKGFECAAICANISNRGEIISAVEESKKFLGGDIEILVNSAGIQRRAPSHHFLEADWDEVISINLKSVFLFSQLVAEGMIKNNFGRIINIASIMGQFGGRNIPAYSASKGGVVQLTKAMANDWAKYGIRVNAISPGYIDTSMNEALLADTTRTAEILSRTPVGRWGTPEDLKGIAILLASDASDFISGAVIPVDGGYSAW